MYAIIASMEDGQVMGVLDLRKLDTFVPPNGPIVLEISDEKFPPNPCDVGATVRMRRIMLEPRPYRWHDMQGIVFVMNPHELSVLFKHPAFSLVAQPHVGSIR